MQFEVYPVRREGRLLPRHVMWSGKVVGDLYITEAQDTELNRHVRLAKILDGTRELLPPLLDAVLVAAKPDWWTMTGWERGPNTLGAQTACAYQQSWILIPVDQTP